MTADKADIKRIKEGNVFARDLQTGEAYRVTRSEYAGLPNRSKHMANAKLFYEDEKKGWSASLRVIYKSRWGTYDKDGNGIINREDEFANGSALSISMLQKQLESFRLQAGIDNLFNYKDEIDIRSTGNSTIYVIYEFKENKYQIKSLLSPSKERVWVRLFIYKKQKQ